MRAITLIQPWATLIALGEKKNETRSWNTPYRGKIAIHAGKKIDYRACNTPPIKEILDKYNIVPELLPVGCIIATAELVDVKRMTKEYIATVPKKELSLGYYTRDRFAFVLDNVKALEAKDYIPAKGMLNIWNYKEGK